MFKRKVLASDGTVLEAHEAVRIRHDLKADISYVDVESKVEAGQEVARGGTYGHVLDVSMTFADAEDWLKELDDFEEYVDETQETLDEILAILTDEQAATVPDAFHAWKVDTDYKAGDRRKHEGVLYKCLQAHKSVEGQTPDKAVSLWARILNPDPEVIPVWEQPDSTNPYMIGDKVHYPTIEDPVYESTMDANVYSPEAYPQGWRLVEGGE